MALAAIAPRSRPRASVPVRAPSPIVKWVGGKGRLLTQLTPMLPPGVELMRHVEPFAGGAAMFFARRPDRALLCDVNESLIHTYRMVRDDVESVIAELGHLRRLKLHQLVEAIVVDLLVGVGQGPLDEHADRLGRVDRRQDVGI